MKKRVVFISMLTLFMLSGCSENYKNYKEAVSAMESQDYETAVSILSTISDYKDSSELLKESVSYIMLNTEDISETPDIIDEIFNACSILGQKEFTQLNGASDFEEKFVKYIDYLGQQCEWDKALDIIQRGIFFSDNCIESSLIKYGRWAAIDVAESYVKEKLKSPRSYYRYEASVSVPSKKDDFYTVFIDLNYGATNSFGGEVRNNTRIFVNLYPNLNDKTVEFECKGNLADVLSKIL